MDEALVRAKLNEIHDPCSVASGRPIGLCDMGIIDRIDLGANGEVAVRLRLTSPSCLMIGFFVKAVNEMVGALPGVTRVSVSHDAGEVWEPEMMSQHIQGERAALWQGRIDGLARPAVPASR